MVDDYLDADALRVERRARVARASLRVALLAGVASARGAEMTRGHKGRTDGNHSDVIKALRDASIGAASIAAVGGGVPDIIAGYRDLNVLLEVKDGNKPASERKLTKAEEDWHATWPGQRAVVNSPEEAVLAVLEHARKMGVV